MFITVGAWIQLLTAKHLQPAVQSVERPLLLWRHLHVLGGRLVTDQRRSPR